ncbi:MAG: serine/threonine-protein kinase [Planctomycetota bacterium]
MSEETPEIPGYRLLERLGHGAAGVVYLAQSTDPLGQRFAVKVFPPDAEHRVARELETLREVEAVRRETGSRDLLEVVHAGEAQGRPYVVMEHCPGGDLLSRVQRDGPLPSGEAVALMLPVLRGLELLHAHGWVHKDVKPANVLLGADGQPRLGDFGLTRSLDRGPLSSAGTPGFCAPELYRGAASESGAQLDVYSAAATLYFLLTGEAPLAGRPDVFPLERRRVPRPLQRVLVQALQVDPAQRVPGAARLRELLEAADRGEPGLGGGRRRRGPVVLGALLVLGGAAVAWAWRPAPLPPPSVPGAPGLDLRWSTDGRVSLGDGPSVSVFDAPPVAVVADPTHTRVAALARSGALAVVSLDPPRVLTRIPPPSSQPLLVSAALEGTFVARLWAPREGSPRLELYALPGGTRLASCAAQGVGEALVLVTDVRGQPWAVIGTLAGDLVVQPFDVSPAARVRSHGDSILRMWRDPAGEVLYVSGDDRELSARPTGDEVELEDGRGLSRAPQLVTRRWDLPALLEGHAQLLGEGPAD